MRTSAFIGLIFLVAALLVASTPDLLNPTAHGVEKLAVKAGLLEPGRLKVDKKSAGEDGSEPELAPSRLRLKGYTLQADGDLSDTIPTEVRGANRGLRLSTGSRRTLLPGQVAGLSQDAPPIPGKEGVLLDANSCPVFHPKADVFTLMLNDETRALYSNKAAAADDPDVCVASLNARIEAAVASSGVAEPGVTARLPHRDRRSAHSELISLNEVARLTALLDVWVTDAATAAGTNTAAAATAAAPAATNP